MSTYDLPVSKSGKIKILVVDPGKKLANLVEKNLDRNTTVERVTSGDTALQIIALSHVDLIITQLWLPLFSGLDLAYKLEQVRPDISLIVVSSNEKNKDADELFQLGYPPVIHLHEGEEELLARMKDILAGNEWLSKARAARDELKKSFGFDRILSIDPGMRVVHERLKRVVSSKVPVLITGESGTGKELVARMIHTTSDRSRKPFISVNCAAVPEGLLESQFFGHEKGAFTGAIQRIAGRFELANGGSLFLDEIGEMSPTLQAKLLRVIEYGEFERVGGTETIKVDVRLITATNRNLEYMVERGNFRTDLFYRINVFPIQLPPLHQRGEDVILLAYYFLYFISMRNNRQLRAINDEAIDLLRRYPWPGNVRELENVIERAFLLCDGTVLKACDFPTLIDWSNAQNSPSVDDSENANHLQDFEFDDTIRTLAEIEREAVHQALEVTNGNVALAARRLGIARGTLYKKIEEHGLDQGKIKA